MTPRTITHFFACPRCDRVATVDSVDGATQAAQLFATANDADTTVWLPVKRNAGE